MSTPTTNYINIPTQEATPVTEQYAIPPNTIEAIEQELDVLERQIRADDRAAYEQERMEHELSVRTRTAEIARIEQEQQYLRSLARRGEEARRAAEARSSAPLPPLESVIKKAPGWEKLPNFDNLKNPKASLEVKVTPDTAEITGKIAKKKKERKVLQAKRIKKAATLTHYRIHSIGHPVFYRYVRLPDNNTRTGKPVFYGPNGGACMLINTPSRAELRFSFAICKDDEPFIKDEANYICQQRLLTDLYCIVSNINPEASIFDNIVRGYENLVYNNNRDRTSPLLSPTGRIALVSLKKLYKMIKNHIAMENTYA